MWMVGVLVTMMLRLLFGRHYSHTAPAGWLAPSSLPPGWKCFSLPPASTGTEDCSENATIEAPAPSSVLPGMSTDKGTEVR
uniref:Putative secreted protein n=1 Tax=Anopheles marajoara TaxID=58244 RepID=A0A2M4CBM4_9DIPT